MQNVIFAKLVDYLTEIQAFEADLKKKQMHDRVEAMESHALAEAIRVETMGQPNPRKSSVLCGFPEMVDMFPRTFRLEADEANFDMFR